jgi:two-component sensor histidine kinase
VENPASPPRTGPPAFALTAVAWSVVGAIFIIQNVVRELSQGRAISWRRDGYEEAVYWIAFAVLTPLLVWLCRRFSFIHGQWRRAFLAHLFAAPAVAGLQVAIDFALLAATDLVTGALPAAAVPSWVGARGALFLLLAITAYWKYWVIVGLMHGVAYARLYSREQRAAAELRAQLSDAQLDRLRAQLQPHFLFNTLNSIAVLLRDQPERARAMVLRLSEMLRGVVYAGDDQFVPLSRELAFVRQYLDIQRMRFGERLHAVVETLADPEREIVPHFLIQPLVENAVQHGIATTESGGTVFVRIHRRDGQLHIEVVDAPAAPEERGPDPAGAGLGLATTRQRLAKLYDGAARLTMDPVAGGGMRVDVRIPSRPSGG